MRESLDEPVEVVAYDRSWPERFAAERERIAAALCGHDVAIEHIGGTAVPGLAARPVIDVMIGGREGEVVVPGGAAAAVHVVERGGRLWRDSLLVRDFLRSHDRARERLGEIKRRAARDARGSLSRYAELKAPAMQALVAIARVRAWAAGRPDVRGLFLVGSHARGDARPDSDVDLVLLCDDPSVYAADTAWVAALDGEVIATRTWGMLTERRLRLDGVTPDVELGIVTPDWDRSATAPHICDLRLPTPSESPGGSDPFT